MVKIDVKIDDNAQEEDDKDYYDDEIKAPTKSRTTPIPTTAAATPTTT